jgi:pSer/pThr/pTyr-binding forkhead associated (FHA) protein
MSDRQIMLRNAESATAPMIKLTQGTIVIGRDATCGIVLADPSVSRFHAELVVQATSITVRDLGSRNGTYVDSELVDEAALTVGQSLQVGAVHFAIEMLGGRSREDGSAKETASVDDARPAEANGYEQAPLSAAERRVFELMLPGLAEKEIAGRIGISRHTVHTHIRKIYEAFGVRSRAEFSALFIKPPNGISRTPTKAPGPTSEP